MHKNSNRKPNWTGRTWFGLLTAAFMMLPTVSRADEPTPQQGSTAAEIAALKARPLPQPAKLKVAILPFHDVTGSISHVRMTTVANYLLWQREGFEVLPLTDSFKVIEADKDIEPGLPLRRTDAARLGKALGADWVVYGEVKQLDHYTKSGLFKEAKYLIAGVRIAVVDVHSGDTLYWHARSDKTGGTGAGMNRKADTLKRRGAIIVSMNALKPLFDALPAHQVNGKTPDSGEIVTIVERLWPNDKNND
jgi:TolB-like protein